MHGPTKVDSTKLTAITPKMDCEKDTTKTRRMFSDDHHISVPFKVTADTVLVLRYNNHSFAYSHQN